MPRIPSIALVAALACAFGADAQTSIPPLPVTGPYPVACSNIEQDASRVPPGETIDSYWRGRTTDAGERYVSSLLVDPAHALVATFTAPDDEALYARWSGRPLTYVLLACYPTTPDNARADYALPGGVVVPRMQRGAEPPLFAPSPARLPVLAYSHGYGGSPLSGEYLDALIAFASWGYVTIAPFHGDLRYTAFGPDGSGVAAFVYVPVWSEFVAMQATRALSMSSALDVVLGHPQWRDRVDPSRIGAFGISQGGETTMLAAGAGLRYDLLQDQTRRVTLDTRIRAGVGYVPYFGIDALHAFGRDQQGVDGVTMPFFAISGSDDRLAPADVTRQALDRMRGVRGQVILEGQGHELDPGSGADILTWSLAFLSAFAQDDATARGKLRQGQSVSGGLDDRKELYAGDTGALPSVANRQGLWWAAPAGSESGWGINLAHQGEVIFATWFTYDGSGRDWWLSANAYETSPGVFAGTLYETRGPRFDSVPFDPSGVTSTPVGTATLDFAAPGGPTFRSTVNGVTQLKTLTMQQFGPLPTCTWPATTDLAAATNVTDLWWASPAGAESGWGVNFSQQGELVFATWFTYAADNRPMWVSGTLARGSGNTFTGTLNRTRGPSFDSVPFDPSKVVATPAGSMTVAFADGSRATMSYTIDGVSQQKPITRQVFRAPGTACR